MNSLKHGLCIEKLALPNEDAAVLRGELDRWNDFYRPASPGEGVLIEKAVTAYVQQRRAQGYQVAHLGDKMRKAERRWDEGREDEVAGLARLLEGDPDVAVRALRRIGHGCRWLIARWEHLGARLEAEGGWTARERDEALRLQGLRPDPERLRDGGDGAETLRYSAPILREEPEDAHAPQESIDLRDVLELMDKSRRGTPRVTPTAPDRATCLAWLRARVAGQLASLREREEWLRQEYDEPERAEAADRAQLLEGTEGANWLRYERMHELAFHRAYGALLKGRKEAAETGLPPGAPNEASSDMEPDASAGNESGCPAQSVPEPAPPRAPAAAPDASAGCAGGEVSARPRPLAQAIVPNEARKPDATAANRSRFSTSAGNTAVAAAFLAKYAASLPGGGPPSEDRAGAAADHVAPGG